MREVFDRFAENFRPGAHVVGPGAFGFIEAWPIDAAAYSLKLVPEAVGAAGFGGRVELVKDPLEDRDCSAEFNRVPRHSWCSSQA